MASDDKNPDGLRRPPARGSAVDSAPLDLTVDEGLHGARFGAKAAREGAREAPDPDGVSGFGEDALDLPPGEILGNYQILGRLGAGGMGQIFRARDTELEREVALKLLQPSLTRLPSAMSRFRREARLLASVNHPNIAVIHGAHEAGGVRFLVMELVEGETLAQRLAGGPLSVPFGLDVGRQIAAALEAAHRKGIVHRDLKPANVMVSPEGWVKVLDFGLAKALAGEAGGISDETRVQGILGTAPYMSPEQVREQEADWRSDVWAFGCVLFEMATGARPFLGPTRIDILRAILDAEPAWGKLPPGMPAAASDLLRLCLTKDPGQRSPSMGGVRAILEEALAGLPAGSRDAPPRARGAGPAEVSPAALGIESSTLGYLDSLGEYTVVERIAVGGQGEVYRAWDRGRKRDTALKVLRSELLADPEARSRLQEEARALTWLRHPNVANLYDFGSAGGVDFVVTEYVAGNTLAARLADGPLPEVACVRLGAQIAAALAEAHEHGILHRDLKASNVMVTPDGQAKVIDFGLARMTAAAPGAAAALAGPLLYLAPEVVRGEEPDVRSDLYSLGVVLYAMATGRPPFAEMPAAELTAAVLHRPPAPPRQRRPSLSPGLEKVILACLEKAPERRPASARELAAELAGLSLGLPAASSPPSSAIGPATGPQSSWPEAPSGPHPAAPPPAAPPRRRPSWIAGLADGLGSWLGKKARPSPLASLGSVVVLPSRLVGPDPDPYLGDAIAQILSSDLARIPGITAKLPPSSFDVERLGGDVRRVAQAYGAEAMVLSTAGRERDELTLSLQLVETRSRNLLWSREHRGAPGDPLGLARRAARDLRQALRPEAATPPPVAAAALSPEVERLVQQGLYFANLYRNRGQAGDQERAVAAFEKALGLAPERVGLAGEIAMLYALSLDFGVSILEVQPEIRGWAERALALDPRCSKAWAALAYLEGGRQKDGYRRQLEYLLKAASYDPGDAYAANRLSGPLARLSYRLALASSQHASEIDPLVLTSKLFEAVCLTPLGRHAEALARVDETLGLEPGMPFGLLIHGLTLGLGGRYGEALALVEGALERLAGQAKLHPAWVALTRDLAELGLAAERRDEGAAEAAASRLLAMARGESPFPRWEMTTTEVAAHLARCGRQGEALDLLRFRSEQDLVQPYDYLLLSPNLAALRDAFRGDPRLAEVLARARLRFEEILAILEEARARGELPSYLEAPLAGLLKGIRQAAPQGG